MADVKQSGPRGRLIAEAFDKVLGVSEPGAMAFVRCLTPDVVEALARDRSFTLTGWEVWRVADTKEPGERTIAADHAVEMREAKGPAVLFLVDTERAGAGMDGIYSAAREIEEDVLFEAADHLACEEIAQNLPQKTYEFAEQATREAQRHGARYTLSRWARFDFFCRVATGDKSPGANLHLLGLWPVQESEVIDRREALETSRLFVDRLLGTSGARFMPSARINTVRLDRESGTPVWELEQFLQSVDTKSLSDALAQLANKDSLWIGNLRTMPPAQSIRRIKLTPWRNRRGILLRWSGLVEDGAPGEPPAFVMDPDADRNGNFSTLEVRWTVEPPQLKKDAVEYRVTVRTDSGEELAIREVPHSGRQNGEKGRFTDDDFSSLDKGEVLPAKVVVEVVDNQEIVHQESEDFIIRFGTPPVNEGAGGAATKVRAFVEGLAELNSRTTVSEIASSVSELTTVDSKNHSILLRTPAENGRRKSFRVVRPPLIAEVEKEWVEQNGAIGRWVVKVRDSGVREGSAEFVPSEETDSDEWARAVVASRNLAPEFAQIGGAGQVYDDESVGKFRGVQEYLRAWTGLLRTGDPSLSLANTVEVQLVSGRTIGLIVLPGHPLRVAWHAAYDNLVLHTAFEQEQNPQEIRSEFAVLDGATFPTFLPNPSGDTFVFADMLGFHAVGMVPDTESEPKAAVAIMARALGDDESEDNAPTIGAQSAKVLADEIDKYLECHRTSRLLHVHALRAGDGMTVVRSLGNVLKRLLPDNEDEAEEPVETTPVFSLDLYPSADQRDVSGRFIVEEREKHRSGAGVLASDDRWMLESLGLPGGFNMPKLRWARKDSQDPNTAAHLAIAFDTFESQVVLREHDGDRSSEPYHAFGLIASNQRHYDSRPSPVWTSTNSPAETGEKHPSRRTHTETLGNLQSAIQDAVSRHLGTGTGSPVLKTEISPEKADSLDKLHRFSDWVITLDRNAGIEYFDSPEDNKEVYDAYVINCVPEREDIGCLQLITSTTNLEEMCDLLGGALDQMGLSHSRRNAEHLLGHLKALSGRLTIRLTGHQPATSELVALAASRANCMHPRESDDCWVSLENGFIIPVDDVRDQLPPLTGKGDDGDDGGQGVRPDLIYVSLEHRKGLVFRFIEVKYRRHLRTARSPDILGQIERQTQKFRERWVRWYDHAEVCASFRALRRAKLARVLRFYADKARRHGLSEERHLDFTTEISRMIEKGGDYAFREGISGDRGWVFCPEYGGNLPLNISPDGWNTQIYLFGPSFLPDSGYGIDSSSEQQDGPHPLASPTTDQDGLEDSSNATKEKTNGSVNRGDAPTSGARSLVPEIHLGIDSRTNSEVNWGLDIRGNPHLLVAGLPGMGKTTCLVNLCKQMAAANVRPVVFSYHQDIDERLEKEIGDVRFVDFDGLGFNPLRVIDRNARMPHLDVAGAMRDIFAAIYPELGGIQGDRIRTAIKDSFEEAGWGSEPTTAPDPKFGHFLEVLRADPKPDKGLRTLLARLGELDDYGFFDVGDDPQVSLWESERPTVIRIHTTQNENLQQAFAYLVFYGLYKDMFRRGVQERITHALVFDEAHRAARLKLIPTMAKECRKYGISLVLASQEARDFDVSVFSAIANYLVLRSTDTDAKFLVKNVSNSRQERTLIDKIKQMEKFKALYFGENKNRPCLVSLSP